MDKTRMILDIAELLNDFCDVYEIHEYYKKKALDLCVQKDYYSRIVTLLTMCVNKELSIALENDDDILVEQYPLMLIKLCSDITEKYNNMNSVVVVSMNVTEDEREDFLKYLNKMVSCLLSGVKYIDKKDDTWYLSDENNEWNTRYRREERIRDNMKFLFSKDKKFSKFTVRNNIEIPYMYVLAWDLPTLFREFNESNYSENDNSYIGNLRNNTSIELNHISDNLLEILLYGMQIDNEKFEDSDENAPIKLSKRVSYLELLPTITFVDKVDSGRDLNEPGAWAKARKTHKLPLIKKEVLRRKPLLPMEADKHIFKPEESMEMMLRLMKEENKTKDFLNSDIVFLKDCMVKICRMICDWIAEDEVRFTRINEHEAEDYLISLIKAANNVPRKNSEENREDHIRKIINVLAKEWDEKMLADVSVNDKNPDTYVEYSYFSVLKLTRNWNEHNLITSYSISFAVFTFIISMRYLMDINKLKVEWQREYLAEEIKLFRFFGEEKIEYETFDLKTLDKEYALLYANVFSKALGKEKKKWAKYFPDTDAKDPHQVLNTAGYKESKINKLMSENEIFLSFWLSLHYGKTTNITQKIEHTRDTNLLELLERTFKYQKSSFLLND